MKTIEDEYQDEDILRAAVEPQRLLCLKEAQELTGGDRNRTYGEPVANMEHIARIFNAITGHKISARDVTILHQATKMARRQYSPDHRDSYVDNMAYVGIEYECALHELSRPKYEQIP